MTLMGCGGVTSEYVPCTASAASHLIVSYQSVWIGVVPSVVKTNVKYWDRDSNETRRSVVCALLPSSCMRMCLSSPRNGSKKTAFGVFRHWRAVHLERASGTGSYLYLNSCRARLLAVKLRSLRLACLRCITCIYTLHIHASIDIPEAFVTFARTLWTSELI